MTLEPIMNRLRNLYALSVDPGTTDAERDTARRMLERDAQKYNVSLESLLTVEKRNYAFMPKNAFDKKMLIQIVAKVLASNNVTHYHATGRGNHKRIEFKLTVAEYVDVSTMYDFYRAQFYQQIDTLLSAFFSAHNLYSGIPSDLPSKLTDAERERIQNMMKGIRDLPKFHKQLTGE